ncbi:DUF4377 domain-containing protein [Dysgonomonas sp. ZJ279]|uniref:DUF4377 domain-containing protein n=1 Tax=Dysgonomonas sp. ZJ279 TaxID=2709796 RepID=UPI0013EAA9C7|nr:DUF4377 domain-containing protein [Dysgonomonas sp. ZJ279]
MKKIIYLSLSLILVMASCTSNKTVKYTIASQSADCVGVGPQKCMLVKKGNATDWQYFYTNIEGFNYEEGNEYVIEVKEEKLENVPADASSIKYIMLKQLSKTPATSTNLPASIASAKGYQWTGKVLSSDSENLGRGAAAGRMRATVLAIEVTSSSAPEFKEGDTIYCELIASPKVAPVVGREYAFKAKHIHPAHAKGIYMLETDVMDLVQ